MFFDSNADSNAGELWRTLANGGELLTAPVTYRMNPSKPTFGILGDVEGRIVPVAPPPVLNSASDRIAPLGWALGSVRGRGVVGAGISAVRTKRAEDDGCVALNFGDLGWAEAAAPGSSRERHARDRQRLRQEAPGGLYETRAIHS